MEAQVSFGRFPLTKRRRVLVCSHQIRSAWFHGRHTVYWHAVPLSTTGSQLRWELSSGGRWRMLLSSCLSTFDIHTNFKPTRHQSELGGVKTTTAPLVGLVKIWNHITRATGTLRLKARFYHSTRLQSWTPYCFCIWIQLLIKWDSITNLIEWLGQSNKGIVPRKFEEYDHF